MKTFIMDCFEITTPDGVGERDDHVAYVATESLAKALQDGRKKTNAWPLNYRPKHLEIRVFESLAEMESDTRAKLRQRALSKLDAEERKALGITDE